MSPRVQAPRRRAALGAALSTVVLWSAAVTVPILAQPFDVATTLDTAPSLRQVISADIDGDGDPDLVGTSATDDEVFWLENDGSTWPRTVLDSAPTTTDGALDVAVGDLDGDGDLDVVGSAREAGDLVYWLNNGDGTTWTRATITTTAPGIRSVALGDLDLDGDLDVVAAVTGAGDLRWWEQTSGGWTGRVIEGSATDVRHLALADIDGDGDLDVAAPLPGGDLSWWQNPRGAGSPWASEVIGAVVDPSAVAAGDFDGDGEPEILVADQGDDSITRWRFTDDARGTPMWKPEPVGAAGDVTSPATFDLVDLDGDDDLDVLVGSSDDGASRWYAWDGSLGNFVEHDLPGAGVTRQRWRGVDTDGDGDADLVAIERPTSGDDLIVHAQSLRPHRQARFLVADEEVSAFVGGAMPVFTRGDIDGDGAEDLAVADGSGAASGGAQWLRNPRDTADGAPYFVATPIGGLGEVPDTFRYAAGLAIADFDLDGDQDLLIGEQDAADRFVKFCENLDGQGADWDCQIRTPTGVNASFFDVVGPMAAGDLNGDGWIDFVALTDSYDGSPGYDGLHWFENLGDIANTSAAFEAHQITADPVGLTRVQIIDVDNDGDLDVAGTADLTAGALQLQLFRNDGSGGFGSAYSRLLNDDFRLVDLDGDGIVDLVSVYRGQARIQWTAGTGNPASPFDITPTDIVEIDADTPPEVAKAGGLDLVDLDGDGDLDLLSSYQLENGGISAGEVFWMENQLGSTVGARGATADVDEDWVFHPIRSMPIVPIFAFDSTGDGQADVHVASTGVLLSTPNSGGALGVDALDISTGISRGTPTLESGQTVTPALFDLDHQGLPGDAGIDVTAHTLRFTDELGNPWTQAQVDELLGADGAVRLVEQVDGERAPSTGAERGTIELAEWTSISVDFDGYATLDLDDASGPFTVACCMMTERNVLFVLQTTSTPTGATALPTELHLTWAGPIWQASAGNVPVPVQPVPPVTSAYLLDLATPEIPLFADGFETGDTTLWQ